MKFDSPEGETVANTVLESNYSARLLASPLETGIGVHERLQHEGNQVSDTLLLAVGASVDFGIVVERGLEAQTDSECDLYGLAVRQLVEFQSKVFSGN